MHACRPRGLYPAAEQEAPRPFPASCLAVWNANTHTGAHIHVYAQRQRAAAAAARRFCLMKLDDRFRCYYYVRAVVYQPLPPSCRIAHRGYRCRWIRFYSYAIRIIKTVGSLQDCNTIKPTTIIVNSTIPIVTKCARREGANQQVVWVKIVTEIPGKPRRIEHASALVFQNTISRLPGYPPVPKINPRVGQPNAV